MGDIIARGLASKALKLGNAYKFQGSVDIFDDLPADNLQVGHTYFVKSDNTNYSWNGTTWHDTGNGSGVTNYNNLDDKPITNTTGTLELPIQLWTLRNGIHKIEGYIQEDPSGEVIQVTSSVLVMTRGDSIDRDVIIIDGINNKLIQYTFEETWSIISSRNYAFEEDIPFSFDTIKIGTTNIIADEDSKTLQLIAGDNITIAPNVANKTITITSASGSGEGGEYVTLNTDQKINGEKIFNNLSISEGYSFTDLIDNSLNTFEDMIEDEDYIYCCGSNPEGSAFVLYDKINEVFLPILNPFTGTITSLTQDADYIYIGDGSGKFAIYNKSTEIFGEPIINPMTGGFMSMTNDSDKVYCGGSLGQFCVYTKATGVFSELISIPLDGINGLVQDDINVYATGHVNTVGGAFAVYNKLNSTFSDSITEPFGSEATSLVQDENYVYVGGISNGFGYGAIIPYNKSTGLFEEAFLSDINTAIFSLAINSNLIYIGGGQGAFETFDKNTGMFSQIIPNVATAGIWTMCFSNDKVYCGTGMGEFLIYREYIKNINLELSKKVDTLDFNYVLLEKANKSEVLTTNNTTEYIPTLDFHPVTKKYVDDAIANIEAVLASIQGVT